MTINSISSVLTLSNITEDNLAQGLGLSAEYSLHLEIKITESDVPNRGRSTLYRRN